MSIYKNKWFHRWAKKEGIPELDFVHSSRITKRVDKAIDQRARDFHHVDLVVRG